MSVTGTRPAGTKDEAAAARAVQQMFDSIAPRYDLLNHVLSASVDRLWWWQTARSFKAILSDPHASVLDVCCGTGHMTRALLNGRPPNSRPVLAVDFAREMLRRGALRFKPRNAESTSAPFAVALEADALHLPLRPGSLDLIVTAFGFRNLANYPAGLMEFARVLKPGAQLGILDFGEPDGFMSKLYIFYFRHILPKIGRLLSGSSTPGAVGPYSYLPASVQEFPRPAEMLALMRATGYTNCAWQPYTFGIAGLYTGVRTDVR